MMHMILPVPELTAVNLIDRDRINLVHALPKGLMLAAHGGDA